MITWRSVRYDYALRKQLINLKLNRIMENIGYIYAACAYEAPESIEVVPFIFNKKQSTLVAMRLLSVALSLFLLSNIGQALALDKQGSKGASVTAIQSCLKQLGYFNASATGYYGSVTKSAVSKFQKDNGLAIDGIVGSDTKKIFRLNVRLSRLQRIK